MRTDNRNLTTGILGRLQINGKYWRKNAGGILVRGLTLI